MAKPDRQLHNYRVTVERRPYVPTSGDLAKLVVFLSYKTAEWQTAQRVKSLLESTGLKVAAFEPDSLGDLAKQDVAERLFEAATACDAICVVGQHARSASPWVDLEFTEAGMVLGHVIVVTANPLRLPRRGSICSVPRLAAKAFVKESVVKFTDDERCLPALLDVICNDPDEWWFAAINEGCVPAWPTDLKRSIALRKLARMGALRDPRYADRTVVEVVPFEPEAIGVTSLDEVPLWYINSCGRLGLAPRIMDGEIVCDISGYYVPDSIDLVPSGLLHALVLLRGEEDT